MKSIILIISLLYCTLMGSSQSLNNPKNISPLDGKVFSDSEGKAPISFSWTPLTTIPPTAVTYKLRLWQLKQGQTAAEAIRNNTPIAVKDVADGSQTTLTNVVAGGCTLPNLCSFVWNVQAVNRQGIVVGTSVPTSFTVTLYIIQIDSMSVTCLDKAGTYSFYFKVTNPNAGVAKLSNFVVTSSVPAGATITFTPPLSTTIPSLGSLVITGTITGSPILSSICLGAEITDVGNPFWKASKDLCKNVQCPCNPCKDKTTFFGKDSTSYTNGGVITTTSTVSHLPKKVIKVSAQIVNVERLGEAGCLKCTKESKEFGNFTSGTLNSNAGTIVNGGSGYGKDIQWQYNTPTLISNFPYDFQMAFPPLTEVSCCKDSIKICTRWSFMDSNCVTCDTLVCKVIIREYKKTPIIHGGTAAVIYAEQMAKLGEPYNSWYKQDGNELPANFNEQVRILYQQRQAGSGEDVTLEVFTESMKQTFEAIRSLKLTSSDAVWNAISGNPLNSQCTNGDFENGTTGFSDWSGAYGTVSSSNNDPILGTYTSGFNPAVVGLNAVITTFTNNHSIVSFANDPIIGAGLKTTSNSSSFAFRLGNSAVGKGSEILTKKFTVTGNGIIRFNYALVLQDPLTHGSVNNPSFWVKVYIGAVPIIGKVYLDPISSSPLDVIIVNSSIFFQTKLGSTIRYRDWTCAKIDLSQYIGQTVTVALITTDCTQGAHFGYAYIDNWCGNCEGATNGVVNIQAIKDSCIKQTTKVCVNYTLPTIGTTTGTGTITLNFYQSGNLFTGYSLTSTPLTPVSGTYCFNIDPTKLPCTAGKQGYDVVATGNFLISGTAITVTSPDPVGSTGTVAGIKPGLNNDLVCCSTLAENCCASFIKTVVAPYSMVGNSTSGYNTIKFVPSFHVGPKPIKKVVISIENFEINSNNKECLICDNSTHNYGSMSVPQNILGGGKDPIEGMTYPTNPLILTCVGCPPTWTGYLSHSVTWGSNNGPGYNLWDNLGDESTTFFVHLPKKSTLVCCYDTIKVCVKYSFTDTSCVTCDTVICYKIINRQNPAQPFRTGFINSKSRSYESFIGLRYKDFEETAFSNTNAILDSRTATYDLFSSNNSLKAIKENKLEFVRDKPRIYVLNGAKY
jgi:hypothetical protein